MEQLYWNEDGIVVDDSFLGVSLENHVYGLEAGIHLDDPHDQVDDHHEVEHKLNSGLDEQLVEELVLHNYSLALDAMCWGNHYEADDDDLHDQSYDWLEEVQSDLLVCHGKVQLWPHTLKHLLEVESHC